MRDFHMPGRSAVFAENGLCATSHPLAAKVAISLLEAGGNAVDAAIGAAILLGICEPQSTGIGGDCFALVKLPGKEEILGLNGSGRAPAGLDADMLRSAGHSAIPQHHPAAVTVPGAIDGFCRLHDDLGRLDLAEVLAPAIHYADAGVPVAPRVGFDWTNAPGMLHGRARDFYLQNGTALKTGAMFRAPGQAEVLRRIAQVGRAGFYESEVAEDMVTSLRALGGSHTLEDFCATACDYVTPVSTQYRDVDLIELPPNGQGATALLLANILGHFDLPVMDPLGAARAHIEAEATKLAYDTRNRIVADFDHTDRLAHMLDPALAVKLAGVIDPRRAMPDLPPLTEGAHKDTVYITVVDKDRMAVSLIYSIFSAFGAGLASDRFGILFHHRGTGFNLIKGHPNEAGGGKRPLHTIIPGFLREADGALTPFGVMGGQYQATGHIRFLSNMVDFGMDMQTAIDAPRCFSEPAGLRIERGYAPEIRQQLADLGHRPVVPDGPIGGAQAIRIDMETGILQGASDPRKDGIALGY